MPVVKHRGLSWPATGINIGWQHLIEPKTDRVTKTADHNCHSHSKRHGSHYPRSNTPRGGRGLRKPPCGKNGACRATAWQREKAQQAGHETPDQPGNEQDTTEQDAGDC